MIRFQSVLILFALVLLCGCTAQVHLIKPFPDERLTFPGGDAPEFRWEIPNYPGSAKYKLEIATDPAFEDMVLKEEGIELAFHKPETEKVFLPGDTQYHWRVSAYRLSKYGKVVENFPCKESRSFYIEKRPTVRVLVKIPPPNDDGMVTVRIGDEEFESDFARDMEVGERINLIAVLETGDGVKEIGGKLIVHTSNETTKYGNIIVDALTQERMKEIVEGKVGDYYFTLGGEKIVTVTLGSRTGTVSTGLE